ncbi:ribokinase [Virgibacillus siamensis]|uniref:ribokinase n=1 Tax=Virgibacillus siamensis TaxID=480071 RepID=UPI000986CB16|nr:ribokinase [Virgibacillus siamensis]
MKDKPTVCIVGSINMDLTVSVGKMPVKGETTLGDEFFTNPGGKGANQAVAAARMGAAVNFIGAVGDDPFGKTVTDNLKNEGIDTEGIISVPDTATGIANIILSERDNRIIVVSGANNHVTPELVESKRTLIEQSDIVLLQLEIPINTIETTVQIAREAGVPVMLNPAPFQQLNESVLHRVTYLTPNELEARELQNSSLVDQLAGKIVTTKGHDGVAFTENGTPQQIAGHEVEAVDTTGAGDTFNGALATEIARGENLHQAILVANAAAAISVTKIGAQHGMPTRNEVEAFLEEGEHA